jgi:arylsulfatase A-like enzyme
MRVSLFAMGTALILCASVGRAADAPVKPNIVFILADDLGINDLSCYGRKDQKTPHLDKLAAEGMRFTCSYCAQPICSPSRAAILTGKTPARLHLTTFLPGRPDAPSQKLLHPKINTQLPLEETTLAEVLKEAGYATACIGKWHLGGKGFSPEQQGFDFVHAGNQATKPSDTEGGKGEYGLTRQALQFIEQNKEKPFFLYLAHYTPHIPLGAKPKLIEKYRDAFSPVYAAMIESLDDTVGMLLAKLDELKLAEKTIVIFTSDNGGLHVLESPDSPSTHNTPFRAGKGFLYEGGLRVPLIVRWPNQVPAGRTIETPVINTDWTPTFVEICGLKTPAPLDGVSITLLLKGGDLPPRALLWHFPHYTNQGSRPAGAVREGDWKLIEHYEDGKVELFNLAQDISEEHDVTSQEPKRTEELRTKLAEWRKAVGAQENKPNPNFDRAWHKRLYEDVDVSKLKGLATAAEMRAKLQEWRAGMNAVLPKMKKSAAP